MNTLKMIVGIVGLALIALVVWKLKWVILGFSFFASVALMASNAVYKKHHDGQNMKIYERVFKDDQR